MSFKMYLNHRIYFIMNYVKIAKTIKEQLKLYTKFLFLILNRLRI